MNKRQRKKSAGQSIVEFALVGPVFFLLIFGILEGGRLLWTVHTLTNATKEGARYTTVRGSGSDTPATTGTIKAHMLDVSTGLDGDALDVNLDLLDGNMNDQSEFQVESTYEHQFIVTAIFGLGSITLESSSADQFWRGTGD